MSWAIHCDEKGVDRFHPSDWKDFKKRRGDRAFSYQMGYFYPVALLGSDHERVGPGECE